MKRIGVYGSLRSGGFNHMRFGLHNCKRLADTTIIGSMDLAPAGYPRLYAIGEYDAFDREYIMEVYEVDDTLYGRLNAMEEGAGYYPQYYMDDDGEAVYYWLMDGLNHPFNKDSYLTEYTI